MESNEIHEAEVVREEMGLARPSIPTTINDLAAHDRGVEIVEQRARILNTLRQASLQLLMPNDITLFKNDDGVVTGFVGDQGCDRVKKLWGIQIQNLGEMERVDDPTTGEFAYSITGDGVCNVTGETVFNMEGIRYSTEDYARQKPDGIQRVVAVKKAARANLDGGITRELAGLKSVPAEELVKAWEGTWKKLEMCNKGRGYGSKAERRGAEVQQSSDIETKYQPKCSTCNGPMRFVAAGKSAQGNPYDAFWSCQKRDCKFTMKHELALAEARRMKASEEGRATPTREPGDEQGA
jgi:hypothetical protein